jgi:hypothetical protein
MWLRREIGQQGTALVSQQQHTYLSAATAAYEWGASGQIGLSAPLRSAVRGRWARRTNRIRAILLVLVGIALLRGVVLLPAPAQLPRLDHIRCPGKLVAGLMAMSWASGWRP